MADYPVALTAPPAVDDLPSRPRVLNRLVDPLHLLTIAIAPSGAGKSVAAKQSADARGVRTAWVRLAPGYGSARDLVALTARSLGLEAERAELAPLPDTDAAVDASSWADALGRLLDGAPTTLVIDDYDHADADMTDPVLAEVVSLLDPQSKIIVAATRRPSGLIGRLRGVEAPKVDVVTAADIVCTPEELELVASSTPPGGTDPTSPPEPASDPAAAIDAALGEGRVEEAADLLAAHLEDIGAERAVRWFFRLPADRRRELPALVAAARVAMDANRAVFDARRRVDEAIDEPARRDALVALGAVLARRGELAAAAAAFADAALAASDAEDAEAAEAAEPSTWLGIVRWWVGDLDGAREALGTAADALGVWARAEVEIAAGELDAADEVLRTSAARTTDAPAVVEARAHLAWARGDVTTAASAALAAYEGARASGGFGLTAAATTYLWMMLDAGEEDEVLEIADFLDRRVGRHDLFTRTHVALLQLAVALARGDRRAVERSERRVAECRAYGFAPIELEARRRLGALARHATAPLEVRVLGPTRVLVDEEPRDVRWSRPAHEVLLYLALVQDRTATRNAIGVAVWPDADPPTRMALVRRALAEIRTTLEPLRPLGEPSAYLHTDQQRVTLLARTDYERSRSLADEGHPADALALFAGELLEDEPFLDWARGLQRATRSFQLELADRVAHDAEADPAIQIVALELILGEQPWDTARWTRLESLHRAAGADDAADDVARRHAQARTGFF